VNDIEAIEEVRLFGRGAPSEWRKNEVYLSLPALSPLDEVLSCPDFFALGRDPHANVIVIGVEDIGPVPWRTHPAIYDDPGHEGTVGIIEAVAAPNVFPGPGQGSGIGWDNAILEGFAIRRDMAEVVILQHVVAMSPGNGSQGIVFVQGHQVMFLACVIGKLEDLALQFFQVMNALLGLDRWEAKNQS
jgi:hypothetical protein